MPELSAPITNIKDKFCNLNKSPKIVACSDNSGEFEILRKVPEELGVGNSRIITLFSGICLCISNCRYFENFESEIDETIPGLGFGFCLSGQTNVQQDCLKHKLFITGNQSAFYHFPDMKGSYEVISGKNTCSVGVQMKPDFFRSLMEEEQHFKSVELRKLVEYRYQDTFRYVNSVTPSMQLLVRQILNCPYKGLMRRFFFEAKAMELIFYKLKQLEFLKAKIEKPLVLKADDIERIYHAGELLTKNLQNPPGLVALSRAAGMSRTKLLKDFPKIFGTSPYNYLRNVRLEKAGTLLNEGEINVTEAAHLVGYSSSSHFSKAFSQHFGITPIRYMRNLQF